MKEIPEFTYLLSKDRHRYYGIGELESFAKDQIETHHIPLEKGSYKCQCPYCLTAHKTDKSYEGPYEKFKLYVAENFEFAHCFRCDRVFLDIHKESKLQVRSASFGNSVDAIKPVYRLEGDKWNVDMFELFKDFTEEGLQYLVKKRHSYMAKLYKILKIRFFKENPVIPFFYHGELIYFQIKYADKKKHGIPYFSPPIADKPAYIIEHGSNSKFVIVEGVFDAIACLILFPDRTPFAVLGSSITKYQIGMLRSYCPEDILIFMDETSISRKIKDTINDYVNYAHIEIHPSNGEDPEEYMKRLKSEEANNE